MSTTTIERRRERRSADEPAVEIDPRIADRRSAVQREHRRKRRRILVALSVVTALVLAAIGLTRSAALDVDHVDVMGADRTTVDGLIGASGLALGSPMTEIDLSGARRAIAELPWIADVRVERQWPNKVSIAVRERVPVAAVPTADEQWALVDEEGHVLTVAPFTSERWVRIEGLEPAGEPGTSLGSDADDALAVAAALWPDLRDGLDRLVVDDEGEITLHFATGPKARLGGVDHLEDKLGRVASVFAQVDPCGIDVIDVRAELISVTRVPSCVIGAEADTTVDGTAGADPAAAGAGAATEPATGATDAAATGGGGDGDG